MESNGDLAEECRRVLDIALFYKSERKDSALFGRMVRAWCVRLGWQPDVADAGLGLYPDYVDFPVSRLMMAKQTLNILIDIWDGARIEGTMGYGMFGVRKIEEVGGWLKKARERNAASMISERLDLVDHYHYEYALIALAVAAAGYVVLRVRSRRKAESQLGVGGRSVRSAKKDEFGDGDHPEDTQQSMSQTPVSWGKNTADESVLVLVVSVAKELVVDAIRRDGIAAVGGDALFDAVQAIWLGSRTDFQLKLGSFFGGESRPPNETEYDVFLLRFDIGSSRRGLERGQNAMDRIDAFRRLCGASGKVEVSSRLSSDVCGTDEFYRR